VPIERKDEAVIELLRARDGVATDARLRDGRVCIVFNIAWGYDIGDDFAHVSTNVSPRSEGNDFDFFFTSETDAITDPPSGDVLYKALPA
jgi:hypothetical protein